MKVNLPIQREKKWFQRMFPIDRFDRTMKGNLPIQREKRGFRKCCL